MGKKSQGPVVGSARVTVRASLQHRHRRRVNLGADCGHARLAVRAREDALAVLQAARLAHHLLRQREPVRLDSLGLREPHGQARDRVSTEAPAQLPASAREKKGIQRHRNLARHWIRVCLCPCRAAAAAACWCCRAGKARQHKGEASSVLPGGLSSARCVFARGAVRCDAHRARAVSTNLGEAEERAGREAKGLAGTARQAAADNERDATPRLHLVVDDGRLERELGDDLGKNQTSERGGASF